MSDTKKKMQAAWTVLLLLWGAFPALSSAASGSGSSSPASDPASDPAEEPSGEPATDPTTAPENIPTSDPDVVPTPTEDPSGTGEGGAVPWPEAPAGEEGGQPAEWPEGVPNPMESPFGGENQQPLPDVINHMPAPEDWAPWMPDPREFANKVLTGAAVQVSILAPTGISYETAVSASTLAAAGALVAVDGPLPIGDAAAAGIVGPGFLLNHGIDANMVPGIDVSETESAEETEPEPNPAGSDTAGAITEEPTPTETNDSTSTTTSEQSYTPDSGGFTTSDPNVDTEESVSTYDPTDYEEPEEQQYTPDSGGHVAWP